jgi:hypothetical protein
VVIIPSNGERYRLVLFADLKQNIHSWDSALRQCGAGEPLLGGDDHASNDAPRYSGGF